MTPASLPEEPEDKSIASAGEWLRIASLTSPPCKDEFPIAPVLPEAIPSVNLESNPALEQILPIEMQPPSPYRGQPLQAPSIAPQPEEQAHQSFRPSRSAPTANSASATKRFWLLMLGAAVVALVVASGLRSQNSPSRRPIPPTRIPQTLW
ncbi:hypothetical protein [Leptolyngbya sp. FACHB-711]|uniref:hypothetical protein n=2 Tax=Leptolyngbya TaxID=47251 RepID=UPI0016881B20|nr:hypothetical protein [Leptolyngbya sp. FACHB-711]MBD1849999.1 hypothetical protein [Cyanobacteria bacterium FACHB-502]MBD2027494.1 hypothetical protein [Leptolyngbya sp. FACHB-711]